MKRVPVILQMTSQECGAACLAMVLTYYGRETTLNECRKYLPAGRDGITARAIAQAARDLGLRVRAFSMEPPSLAPRSSLKALKPPARSIRHSHNLPRCSAP